METSRFSIKLQHVHVWYAPTSVLYKRAPFCAVPCTSNHNGNRLSKADIADAMKYEHTSPKNLTDFLKMLQNFYAITSVIFGQKSKMATTISSWINMQ